MTLDFDRVIDRRSTSNVNKWTYYPKDILPLWIADMDFLTPSPILQSLQSQFQHGVFGYEEAGRRLFETVAAYLETRFSWKVDPEAVVPVTGVGAGMSAAVRTLTAPGDGLLVQPPIFPPFIQLPALLGRFAQQAELARRMENGCWYYEPDIASMQYAVDSNSAKTKLFLLCNPHNPTGRMFTRDELEQMAEFCLQNDILICSDEIHYGIALNRREHIPMASLSKEVENNTITFLGPGKTFNMSGLRCAFAIIPNGEVRKRIVDELTRSVIEVNNLGYAAASAAFSGECDEWLFALREYLAANRDHAVKFIQTEMPELRPTLSEGTYLLWIDCNGAVKSGRIARSPYSHFLEKGKVALADGEEYGLGGHGFVRLNFACPRSTLEEGLLRMKKSLG